VTGILRPYKPFRSFILTFCKNSTFVSTGRKRERSRQLEAEIAIFSREATGTEMELLVPAEAAYIPVAWERLRALQLGRPAS
jgi:hypothetical protein